MNLRHITRFTYKFTNFQGWRVAIRRQGYTLTRYFSDRQYENEETAYEEAVQFRDMVLAELAANPGNELAVLTRHKEQARTPQYPAGLKPSPAPSKQEENTPGACSMRSNKVLQSILQKVCRHLSLDTASVLKLSLYLFSMQYGVAATPERQANAGLPFPQQALRSNNTEPQPNLHHIISELEKTARLAGLPSFAEFSTGRSPMPTATEAELPPPPPEDVPKNMRPPRPSPPFVTIPTKLNRPSITYYKHFYNSPRKQLMMPLPPLARSAPHNGVTGQHHPDLKIASAPPPKQSPGA